jgi:branched-chain amino acid transport system ATP-binding protein
MSTTAEPVLSIEDLSVRYGAIRALNGVSFKVHQGEVFAVLGANGAGKTTLMRSIVGLVPVSSGTIRGEGGLVLSKMRPHRIAQAGFGVVPEGGGTFVNMSVEDNLLVGAVARRTGLAARQQRLAAVLERFPILGERRDQKAGTLSGGERQLLGIARTLMVDCKVLLLDEPSLGLAPLVVKRVFELLGELAAEGFTIIVVEQNARRALELASHALVLERGHLRKQGRAADLAADDEVTDLYLGVSTGAPTRSAHQ